MPEWLPSIIVAVVISVVPILTWRLQLKADARKALNESATRDAELEKVKNEIEIKLWKRLDLDLEEERQKRRELEQRVQAYEIGIVILIGQIEELGVKPKWSPTS